MVTGTGLGAWHQPTPTDCCLLHEPSFLYPHPWGTPSRRRRLPEPPAGLLEPQNTLTGKAAPEINSGLACPPGLCPGLKVKCTGALQVQQPPSLTVDKPPPKGPSAAKGCVTSRAPTSNFHCPPEAQAPWWSPGIRRNSWALDFQPHGGSREKQWLQKKKKKKNRGLKDQVAKPMPPHLYLLVLRFPVRHLDLEGTGRKKWP